MMLYFHDNCFQVDVKVKLLGFEPRRRTLRPGALPTIFKHKVFHIINMNGETANGIRSRKRVQINEQCEINFYRARYLYFVYFFTKNHFIPFFACSYLQNIY